MLKEMLKHCAKKKTIFVEMYGGDKFLSDGNMMAYVGNVAPNWTDEDCAVALELTEEDRQKYTMGYIDDYEEIEYKNHLKCERLRYSVNIDSLPLQPFILNSGEVIFADMVQLRVFRDVYPKTYYFDPSKILPKIYIVVNETVIGAVRPVKIQYETMKFFCENLIAGVKKSAKSGLFGEEEQLSLFDTKVGE